MESFIILPINSVQEVKSKLDSFIIENKLKETKFINFANWTIIYSQKNDEEIKFENELRIILVFGSPIYPGYSFAGTSEMLLENIEDINFISQMRGTYCIILCNKITRKIDIVLDPLKLYHVFIDVSRRMISNSQLLLLVSTYYKPLLERINIIECILTGFSYGINTFFSTIQRVIHGNQVKLMGLGFIGIERKVQSTRLGKVDFRDIVEVLTNEKRILHSILDKNRSYLGISGGYDSRLLLALIYPQIKRLGLFTHFNPKDRDFIIAKKIASRLDIDLFFDSTIQNQVSQKLINEALVLFDGRAQLMMDYFRNEYSISYRNKLRELGTVQLHGVGGEIFRNYNYQPISSLSFEKWYFNFCLNYFAVHAISDKQMLKSFIKKRKELLSEDMLIDLNEPLSYYSRRIYYNYIYLRDWHGLRNSAENRIGYYFSPFISEPMLTSALSWTHLIKYGGRLEAKLITHFNSSIASIESSYGFPFSKYSKAYNLKERLYTITPPSLRKLKKKNSKALEELHIPSYMQDSWEYFLSLDLPFNYNVLMQNTTVQNFIFSLASFLYQYRKFYHV